MPESTSEREEFACSRLDRKVVVTRKMIVLRNASGEIRGQSTYGLDCDSRRKCAVTRTTGKFDWSRCVHPELGRNS